MRGRAMLPCDSYQVVMESDFRRMPDEADADIDDVDQKTMCSLGWNYCYKKNKIENFSLDFHFNWKQMKMARQYFY